MPASGIEICNRCIRYIEFCDEKGEIRLSNFGEIPLVPGVFKDGDILNKNELIKTLGVVKGYLKNNFVKVSIPEEKTYLFNTKLPYLKPEEIRQALEFKLEENVPLKATESSFEFKLIRKPKRNTEDLFLNVSVIPQKTIEEYSDIFRNVGLDIISLETESKVVSRSLIKRGEQKTVMIVHVKDDTTTMSIVSQDSTCFTSSIPVGNNSVLEILKKIPSINSENLKKIPEKMLSLDDFYDEEVYDSLLNIFSVIKDEVEKFSKYWDSQVENHKEDGFRSLDQIILCGRAAAMPGLANHISQNIGIDTVVGNVWQNAFDLKDCIPNLKFLDSLDYAVAIGLAIPSKYKY
jgi:type IV pilus assembly protein PilM